MSHEHPHDRRWFLLAVIGLALLSVMLQGLARTQIPESQWDEKWIILPIIDIVEQGWSVRTAIDFTETKGPALIWPYALYGQLFGGDLASLRLLSAACFSLGLIPLLMLAQRAGLHGISLFAAAGLYALLPYHAILGQLLMSEAMFTLVALWMFVCVERGESAARGSSWRWLGPLLYAVLLSVLLHNRIHAVALSGAVCLVALHRNGLRSWPWWIASIIAGASRLPLWLRWGGLVSPEYQSMHSLGFGAESIAYLLAAMLPWTGIMLLVLVVAGRERRRILIIGSAFGALVGIILIVLGLPSMQDTVVFGDNTPLRFLGLIGSVVRLAPAGFVQSAAMGACVVLGAASLGSAIADAFRRMESNSVAACVQRWSGVSFAVGIAMYGLTNAFVFDRYLLAWGFLMPIVWITALPSKALWLQACALTAVAAWFIVGWLV